MALAWTESRISPASAGVVGKGKHAPFVPATANQVLAATVEPVKIAVTDSLVIVLQDGKVLPVT